MSEVFQQRLKQARHLLKEEEILFLVNDADVLYYSGFTGDSSFLIISTDQVHFITDGRYTEQIKLEKQIDLEIHVSSLENKVLSILIKIFHSIRLKSILLNKSFITLSLYETLMSAFKEAPRIADDNITRDLRMIKDPLEIEIIKKNLIITELGFNLILPQIQVGDTESEIAAQLEYILKKQGSEKPAFETIVASGFRSALPHGVASSKKMLENEIILFDFGVFSDGYASDFTRCYYLGKIIDPKISEIQKVVQDAVLAAEDSVKEGVTAGSVHKAAYDVIDKAGYAEYFNHSTGHGVGLEIHEYPRIAQASEVVLKAGMVFTIEPGIYLPDIGGIRLEDMVVVTKNGGDVLTTTDYSI